MRRSQSRDSKTGGWQLSDSDETQASGSDTRYGSFENGNAADRPKLTVTFIP